MNTREQKNQIARINRQLEKRWERLRTSRSWQMEQNVGEHYVIDVYKNEVIYTNVNLDSLERELQGASMTKTIKVERAFLEPVCVKLNGKLTDEVARLFVQGQCHALALALRELLGWPMVGAYRNHEDDGPGHYCVYSPDTRHFADVYGLRASVTGVRGEFVTERFIRSKRARMLRPNMEFARHFAPVIAAEIIKQESAVMLAEPIPEWKLCRRDPPVSWVLSTNSA